MSAHVLLIPSNDSTLPLLGYGFYWLKYCVPILSPQMLERVHFEATRQVLVERAR